MSINNAVNDPQPPIREVGHRALRSVLTEVGLEYTDAEIRELLASWPSLEPHDDVAESFERIGQEYTLASLSSGGYAQGHQTVAQRAVDAMLSSASANVFKSAP